MRRYVTALSALLAVAAFAAFMDSLHPNDPQTRYRPVPCRILAAPRTLTCANGHVYIVHRHGWQDIGSTGHHLPGVPKQ